MSTLNYNSVLQSLLGSLNAPSRATLSNPMQAIMGANQANAQRGQSILKLLSQAGGAEMQDNQTQYQDQLGQIKQSMMDKGLANTTVGDNLDQGAANNLNYANNRVRENTAGDLARMAASFSTPGPDLSTLAPQMGRVSGRIIQGPQWDLNSFRPFANG